jgi:O-antigen/teichoic acid export membrane protein
MLAAAMVAAGVLALCVAPLLFGVAFQGKFAQGQAILPWTLIYSIWFGLAAVAQNYLWCAEKARWGSLALLVGLAVNVLLNLLLLPRLGLLGAVLATSAANALVLALVCTFGRIAGFQMDRSTWVLLALPLVLCLGPGAAAGVLAILVLDGLVFDRLLTREEKKLLTGAVMQYTALFRNGSGAWRWARRSTA